MIFVKRIITCLLYTSHLPSQPLSGVLVHQIDGYLVFFAQDGEHGGQMDVPRDGAILRNRHKTVMALSLIHI